MKQIHLKTILIASFFFFYRMEAYSQAFNIDDQLKEMAVPSSNVASLLRFSEVPVNYFSGTPDISVPIYTINTGKLSLPISLRYNASGIRVADNSGSAGLGWSLVAEGVIQESIMGLQDNGTYHSQGLSWTNAALNPGNLNDYNLLTSLNTGGLDGAPDVYNFSFAGYSGKFIYADKIRCLPQQNLEISSYNQNAADPAWKIVTPDGTQYFFTAVEYTRNRDAQSVSSSRAWYLTKIMDANNVDSIMLEYETVNQEEVMGRSYSFTTWKPDGFPLSAFSNDMAPNDPPLPGQYNELVQRTIGWQLKRIMWNNGSIEYDIAWNDRMDVGGLNTPRVKNILLYNTLGAVVKVAHLDQSYFQTPNVTTVMGYRLRLDGVTFAPDLNSLASPKAYRYAFEYDALPLPSKLSNRIDHWGYYNGAISNDSRGLIPSFTTTGMHYYGANRDASPGFMKACILNKMIYPTGGYARFDWETNSKTIPVPQLDSVIIFRDSIIYMQMMYNGQEISNEWEEWVTIPTAPADLFGLPLEATFSAMEVGPNSPSNLEIAQAAVGAALYERNTPAGTPSTRDSWYYQAGSLPTYTNNLNVYPGKTYSLYGHVNRANFGVRASITIKWPKKVLNTYVPPSDFVGGVRVGRITLFDNFTGKSVVKKYSYPGCSSLGVPSYREPLSRYYKPVASNQCDWFKTEGMYVGSNSIHNYNAGVQAGYDYVTEVIGENGAGGSNKYFFNNFNGIGYTGEFFASWRYGRLKQKSVYNDIGTEVARTVYYNKTSIDPAAHFGGHTANLIAAHPCYNTSLIGNPDYAPFFRQRVYDFPCDWLYTDTVKTTDFVTGLQDINVSNFDNPQHQQVTRSTLFNPDGSKETTFFKYPTDFVLGTSPTGDAAAVKVLQQKHMHDVPIEQYTQKWPPGSSTPVTVAAGYNQFKVTAPVANNNVVLNSNQVLEITDPVSNFTPLAASGNTLVKDSRYKVKMTAEEYDTRNNIVTTVSDGYSKAGYVWGYDNSIAIAKVTNDSFSNKRAFTSFEKKSKGNWSYDETAIVTTDHITGKQAYNLAGAGLSEVFIYIPATVGGAIVPHQEVPGLYIVSYWKKNGTVTVSGTAPTFVGTTANGWTYCEHLLSNPVNYIKIDGTALIDELRLYPKEAQMESYTYDPLIGVTSSDDASSRIILYEYDAMGRLYITRDVFGNILKKNAYQYQGAQ